METNWGGSWAWGLPLIALTISIHAMGVVAMALVLVRIAVRLKHQSLRLRRAILIVIGVVGAVGLLLAALHGMEAAIWAAAYLWARRKRSLIDDLLLAHLSPTGFHCGVVYVCRPAVDQVARADRGLPFRRIGVIERILHCIQMIEITKILVEAMVGRQELIPVASTLMARYLRPMPMSSPSTSPWPASGWRCTRAPIWKKVTVGMR
jgi:hypothetical protein